MNSQEDTKLWFGIGIFPFLVLSATQASNSISERSVLVFKETYMF